jgi:uncharacterized membrane protein YcaP (DUF421 family)
MQNVFFDSWESAGRTVVITILAYVLIIVLLRASGKRTLSKMNAFDFIVTVALGSTLATVMLNKNVALLDGALAFFLLIYLQYLATWLSVRSVGFSNLIKSTPTLLLYKGNLLKVAMRKERIMEEEILAIIREKGFSSVQDIDAVVLETDGSLTVIKDASHQSDVLSSVRKPSPLSTSA